jgi:hypothetical protein
LQRLTERLMEAVKLKDMPKIQMKVNDPLQLDFTIVDRKVVQPHPVDPMWSKNPKVEFDKPEPGYLEVEGHTAREHNGQWICDVYFSSSKIENAVKKGIKDAQG